MTKASRATPRGAYQRKLAELRRERDATVARLLIKIEYLEMDLRSERAMQQTMARRQSRQSYGAAF